jgi:peptide/nickel transport system substrate-binding protein
LFHSSSFGYAGNTFFFSSPKIDSEIENARKIRNVNQRMAFYRNVEMEVLNEAPGVFLFHSLENIAVQKGIRGLLPHPLSLIRLKSIQEESPDIGLPEFRFQAFQVQRDRVSSATGFTGS